MPGVAERRQRGPRIRRRIELASVNSAGPPEWPSTPNDFVETRSNIEENAKCENNPMRTATRSRLRSSGDLPVWPHSPRAAYSSYEHVPRRIRPAIV